MQYNGVSIPNQSFIASNKKNDRLRIPAMKSEKENIASQSSCLLVNYILVDNIQCTYPDSLIAFTGFVKPTRNQSLGRTI